ncbi:MAG TPA: tyrosine protein phosphatase, partial [Clostridia bacterium]|nr:tyrosine protein phosphatase [Clostridia bacterium]
MIDIHAHLIPGVDDGSVSFFESVRMLEMACQRGVRALVATPHSNIPIQSNYYGEWFENCFKKLQELTKEIPITLDKG